MKRKNKINKRSKGFTGILLLLGVLILGSLFMVGGIIPGKSTHSENEAIYTPLTGIPLDEKDSLQLKTIKFKSCASSAAVGFLVDNSGSMEYGTKMANLKNGLLVFSDNFPPEGIVGMQIYSIYTDNVVPYNFFKNNKTTFRREISKMRPLGATHSKDAFVVAKTRLDAARARFPNHQFAMIFISDGIPETGAANNALCPRGIPDERYCTVDPDGILGGCRCFDVNQDPTVVAEQIKASGVRIFTIGYIHDIVEEKFRNDLTVLMRRVASTPEDFYEAPISNQLNAILQQISTKLCQEG